MSTAVATGVGMTLLKAVKDALIAAHKSTSGPKSLVEYTKAMRVEPIVLVDSDCMFHEGLPDLMQSLQSIFCGYYLQAVAYSTTVGRIDVIGHLGKLNPNRDPVTSRNGNNPFGEVEKEFGKAVAGGVGYIGSMLSAESYAFGLPSFKKAGVKPGLEAMHLGMEVAASHKTRESAQAEADKSNASNPDLKDKDKKDKDDTKPKGPSSLPVGMDADPGRFIAEAANLSVGKMLSVEITDNGYKGVFPVAVRLLVNSVPTASLIHILSPEQDTSWKARWHGWKSGRLDTIKDMIFCQDLIDAHRKKLMDDNTGTYGAIIDRRRKNTMAAIVSGIPSVAECSNMLVMSDTTLAKLELESNLNIKSYKDRQKLFDETSLMIIAVIDKRWDRVTFYTRSIPETTTVSFRDMKISNRGNGPDVAEILKAYQLGNSPSI